MPKNIVATPAAVVAVDRLTLQADDSRAGVHTAQCGTSNSLTAYALCFSEE
jgi:hypothetical protein